MRLVKSSAMPAAKHGKPQHQQQQGHDVAARVAPDHGQRADGHARHDAEAADARHRPGVKLLRPGQIAVVRGMTRRTPGRARPRASAISEARKRASRTSMGRDSRSVRPRCVPRRTRESGQTRIAADHGTRATCTRRRRVGRLPSRPCVAPDRRRSFVQRPTPSQCRLAAAGRWHSRCAGAAGRSTADAACTPMPHRPATQHGTQDRPARTTALRQAAVRLACARPLARRCDEPLRAGRVRALRATGSPIRERRLDPPLRRVRRRSTLIGCRRRRRTFVQPMPTGVADPPLRRRADDTSRRPRRSDFSPLVPPDYLVQPGDEVLLTLWGSVDADLRLVVDRAGRITVPRVGPIAGVRRALCRPDRRHQPARRRRCSRTSSSASRWASCAACGSTSPASWPGPAAYTVSSLSTRGQRADARRRAVGGRQLPQHPVAPRPRGGDHARPLRPAAQGRPLGRPRDAGRRRDPRRSGRAAGGA